MGKTILIVHGEEKQPDEKNLLEGCQKALGEILTKEEMELFKIDLIYYSDLIYEDTVPPTYLTRTQVQEDETLMTKMKHSILNAVTAKHLRDAMGPGEGLDKFNAFYEGFFIEMKNAEKKCERVIEDVLLNTNKKDILKEITKRLQDKIKQYPDDEILIIGHSGGSVFTLQGLWLSENNGETFNIDDFYSIGSPLGLEKVREAMEESFFNMTETKLDMTTPHSIKTRWLNFSDILDPITFVDPKLHSNYKINMTGAHPIDFMVNNDWEIKVPNVTPYHSIYGYLRNPEFGQCIRDYLY